MAYNRGEVVAICKENYLDQYQQNLGIYNPRIADEARHPGVVMVGAESWGILPKNVYIVAKGQTIRPNSPLYNKFKSLIENGNATYIQIKGERNYTYMFSGEIYVIDMDTTTNEHPSLEGWKDWYFVDPVEVNLYDLVSLLCCVVKSQAELLNSCSTLNYLLKTACLNVLDICDIDQYAQDDYSRASYIFDSTRKITNQFPHPNIDKFLKPLDDILGEMISFNEAKLVAKFNEIKQKLAIINEKSKNHD